MQTAQNLRLHAFFSIDGATPDYNRTPGYPLFLAAIYALGQNNTAVVLGQILLAAWGLYLLYRALILLRVTPSLAALGGAALLPNLTSYIHSWNIAPETLFEFCLILAFYFLIRFCTQGQRPSDFLLFSLALNYALWTRPILMYFNLLVIVLLFLFFSFRKISLFGPLLFLICFVVMFGGWSYRNYTHSGVFIFSTIANYNMQKYYAPIITMAQSSLDEKAAQTYHDQLFTRQYPQAANLNAAQLSVLQKKYGWNFIRANFPAYLWCSFSGLFVLLFGPSQTYLFSILPSTLAYVVSGLYAVYLAFVYLIFIFSLIANYQKTFHLAQLALILLSAYLAATSAIMGDSRFRAPFFALLTACAIINTAQYFGFTEQDAALPQ
ncbi:dolichyl-phosphate-mannose-protein mannosyltransferase family [Candidatus Termititenax persephonae]|uniref:Dolichyl-phosphate-mannose-protein mannosyltransferase family n=1 Tax=Candidatus Termititenax persephonae TaxID=2218525 RepID=A0A388TFV8_9BACT|nr:dolichyl-phosphate-mannose-protein mannosyltransferase family [Candidatus Termititenax persephonae]